MPAGQRIGQRVGQRVGIFGGAFDPPHLAHYALAQAAIAQLQLDVLHILPTGSAWHKTRVVSSGADHRLAMAHLAFDDLPHALVDDREIRRAGATYTIDTLLELREQYPDAQLFLVMGADQLAAFDSWHQHQKIAEIATLSVAARAYSTLATASFSPEIGLKMLNAKPGTIEPVQIAMPTMPISATEIRARASRSEPIDHLVKPALARYIATHHLYQNT